MLWRQDGRQRSLTFENLPAAERFKTLLEDHGPDEALRIIELDEIGRHVPTVTEWLTTHIDNLTGVQRAARTRVSTARSTCSTTRLAPSKAQPREPVRIFFTAIEIPRAPDALDRNSKRSRPGVIRVPLCESR